MPVTVITGASTGIGAALARELARRGHAVGLIARRAELLEAEVAAIRAAGGKASWATADVTDASLTAAALDKLIGELGPIDLLVANAGIGIPSPSHKAPLESWTKMFRLNVEGVLNSIAPVIPPMVARKAGHLAVVSSVAGFRGLPGFGAYSASKSAVTTLFESLRNDLRPYGITCTAIHPGFITTPLTAKNKFPMPFLLSAEAAAKIIADGLEKRRTVITFPWQMKLLMGFVRSLPNFVFDAVIGIAPRGDGSS